MTTDILVVEFRPDPKSNLGRLVKSVTGQEYSHTGMVVGDIYYEMDPRLPGAVMRYKFEGSRDLQVMRGRKTGANDTLEFYVLPRDTTLEDVRALGFAWEADILANTPFGWWNLLSFGLKIPYRKLSVWALDHLKIRLPGVEKLFHAHYLCCSAKVDEKLQTIGIDLFPATRAEDVFPGMFAGALKRVA